MSSRPSLLAQNAHKKMILAAGIISENVVLAQTECKYFRFCVVLQDRQHRKTRVKEASADLRREPTPSREPHRHFLGLPLTTSKRGNLKIRAWILVGGWGLIGIAGSTHTDKKGPAKAQVKSRSSFFRHLLCLVIGSL